MRRSWTTITVLLAVLALLGAATPASSAPQRPLGPDQRLDRLVQRLQATASGQPAAATLDNFKLVGHSGLDGFGDYGDLFAHGSFAYVGSRCGAQRQGGDGVQVVDISNPRHPQVVSTLPNPPFTRAEDVTVRDMHTSSFTGALAVVGIQACFGSGHEAEVVPGLRFFDVTHPAQPRLLAHWDLPQGTIGCHEIDAVQRGDGQVLAVCARNLIDHRRRGHPHHRRDQPGRPTGDHQLVAGPGPARRAGLPAVPVRPQRPLRRRRQLAVRVLLGRRHRPPRHRHADRAGGGQRHQDRPARRGRRQPLDDSCQGRSVAGDQPRGLLPQ